MDSPSRGPTNGITRRQLIGSSIAASALLLAEVGRGPAARAAELIRYQFPFNNPDLDDGFWSTKPPRTRPHRGLDFPQPGRPRPASIPAIATGVIVLKAGGGNHPLGFYTVLRHADGKFSGYCHSDEPSWRNVGETIERGESFAFVGNSGESTGPHLHLTLGDDLNGASTGHVQDPYPYIKDRLDVPEHQPPDDDEDDDVIRIIAISVNNQQPPVQYRYYVVDHGAHTYWEVTNGNQLDLLRAQGVKELANQPPWIFDGYRQIP